MTASKDDVLAALGKISGPGGVPLPATGKLSEIVTTDGKVFFSITVDAGEIEEWETVRERAERAIRALPGVQSVMVALTAERAAASRCRFRGRTHPVEAAANPLVHCLQDNPLTDWVDQPAVRHHC